MRACGPGEFRASLEALLLLMALRLSHRFVAICLFPPSSDSWHPTHSIHKFTRATAWGRVFSRTLVGHEFVVASEELPVQCWHHLGVLFGRHVLIHMIAIFDVKWLSNMIPEVLHVGPVGSHAGSHIGAIFGEQNSMDIDSQTDPFG